VAFSIDLRERVISAIDNNMRITEAVKLFKVSRRVIYEWLDLRKITGGLTPKTGYQKGHSHKITDWEKFKAFAHEHHKSRSPQMIIAWEKLTGVKVSESVMLRGLKKINFTSKKKLLVTQKRIKRNEKSF
jgi:transposase